MSFDTLLFCIVTIIFILILVLCSLFCHYRSLCRRKAKCQVKAQSDKKKLQEINHVLAPFGFAYDPSKDIFYSLENAWQKEFGYGKLYDDLAPLMNMAIDCEPIYFDYDGKKWLIEFWKGQYGITTGAEIGLYVNDGEEPGKSPEDLFYSCVPPKDQLPITMALYKNGKLLFQRSQNHWWLTGFVLGEFSYPGELMLNLSLAFENLEMMDAFLTGCCQAGYQKEDLCVSCSTVSLCLYRPKNTRKPHCCKIYQKYVQWQNRLNCRLYAHVTKSFGRTIDRLYYLMLAYPHIFRFLTRTGRLAWEKRQKYKRKQARHHKRSQKEKYHGHSRERKRHGHGREKKRHDPVQEKGRQGCSQEKECCGHGREGK